MGALKTMWDQAPAQLGADAIHKAADTPDARFGAPMPGWKGSMGQRPNHSNLWTIRILSKFCQNLGKFVRIHQKLWNLKNLKYFLETAAKFRENLIRIGSKINENRRKIVIFAENLAKMRKSLMKFCWDFQFRWVRRCDNLVDLEKCWKMSIYLQRLVLIQRRTSRLKFDDLAEKSE